MNKEENVYEDTTRTEEKVVIGKNALDEAAKVDASTVLGKFKDVNALAKAYEALQAEFTRRSQKLRALERSVENFKETGTGDSGVEKLRKNAQARRAENKRFDEFVADMGAPFLKTQETNQTLQAQEENGVQALEDKDVDLDMDVTSVSEEEKLKTDCVTDKEESASVEQVAQTEAEKERICELAEPQENIVAASGNKDVDRMRGAQTQTFAMEKKSAQLPSEELFQQANRDEAVRLRIIGEYLASLGKSDAPLTMGGVGALATPPAKARSIGGARDMALMYFKKTLQS